MIEVRPITNKHIDSVVTIHLDAFKGFFLTDLGEDFLYTYYDSVRKNDRGLLLGCFEDDKLLGFCASTKLSAGFNSYLVKKNLIQFIKNGFLLLFKKPLALVHISKNFTKLSSNCSDDGKYAELLSIAVSTSAQGKGIGKILLSHLELVLREMNIELLSLTTDYNDNDKTLKFYNSLDYEVLYDFIAYPERKMYRLIKKL